MRFRPALPRRALLRALSFLAGAALLPTAGRSEEKLKKEDAKYQTMPKGQQRCEICLQFAPPNRCKLVAGEITPKGWCQYFAARENAR